ncbi:Transcriptional Regulator, AraC family protein [Limnobacter sp. 130]|uniref:AraC family transcriptional regulator n=1 Tax=Limnobacter sp. 130 TaxID=2653147 RepID=UPI0012F21E85|nr:AraC family transcriptional regulator [Limnobacter sp. 130]VWX34414.1 Transcriptional Regulator, AraC family protein [Limnobacter sp. 130]
MTNKVTSKASNLPSNTPTALASWMRGLAREIEHQGCDAHALFSEAGLDFDLLDSPEARYPVPQTTLLWQKAVALTGDETLGIKAIRHITPATFHAVGLSVMASETLEQAFGRMRRFVDLVTDASEIELLSTEREFVVELKLKDDAQPAHQSTDGFLCLLANAGKGLGDASLVPLRVELSRPAPQAGNLDFFEKSFAAPLTFGCNTMRIVYELTMVRTRLKGANTLIAEHLDQASQAAIDRLKPASSVSRKLRDWVANRLPQGAPSIEDAATYMNMSARNLQRKLADEGTNLAGIVDEIRQSEAMRRLKQSGDSLTAIALDLGFSDASAFSRACKRWFGKSPSDIRGAQAS